MGRYCFHFAEHGWCRYEQNCRFSHTGRPDASNITSDQASSSAPNHRDELDRFFSRYRSFDYDRTQPSTQEFRRLFSTLRRQKQKEKARTGFREALVGLFNDMYGIDGSDLVTWQEFCVVLEVRTILSSITECKKAIARVHVNLVDLVDCKRRGRGIRRFGSVALLREYTVETKKYFPRDEAKAGGLLKFLLRPIRCGTSPGVYG